MCLDGFTDLDPEGDELKDEFDRKDAGENHIQIVQDVWVEFWLVRILFHKQDKIINCKMCNCNINIQCRSVGGVVPQGRNILGGGKL